MGVLLVTGGVCFIGSALAKIALERGWVFRVLGNRSNGIEHNVEVYIERKRSTLDWKPVVDFEEGIEGLIQERLSLK